MSQTATSLGQTSRLTVDLPDGDYQALRLAAASSGKGVTISSLVRQMIHEYLENLEDEADSALVAERRADPRPLIPGAEARARFAAARRTSG
jgi:predicted DNA-binding protein